MHPNHLQICNFHPFQTTGGCIILKSLFHWFHGSWPPASSLNFLFNLSWLSYAQVCWRLTLDMIYSHFDLVVKWPPRLTLASGLFWWVCLNISKYAPKPSAVSSGFEGPLKPWWGQLRTIRKVHSHSVLFMLFISVPVKSTFSYENFIVIHTGLVNPDWRLTQVGDVTSIYRLHSTVQAGQSPHMLCTWLKCTLPLIRGGGVILSYESTPFGNSEFTDETSANMQFPSISDHWGLHYTQSIISLASWFLASGL